jgi:hypothetical protein
LSIENPPQPLQGGDAHTQPLLFEEVLFEQRIFNCEKKKLNAVVNHPLPGGAKLMNDFTVNDLGWVSSRKRKLKSIVNVEHEDKNYQTHKSAHSLCSG